MIHSSLRNSSFIAAKLCFAGLVTGHTEANVMRRATQAIFEMLAKFWWHQDCTLVDTKLNLELMSPPKKLFLLMSSIKIAVDVSHQEIKGNRKTVTT